MTNNEVPMPGPIHEIGRYAAYAPTTPTAADQAEVVTELAAALKALLAAEMVSAEAAHQLTQARRLVQHWEWEQAAQATLLARAAAQAAGEPAAAIRPTCHDVRPMPGDAAKRRSRCHSCGVPLKRVGRFVGEDGLLGTWVHAPAR